MMIDYGAFDIHHTTQTGFNLLLMYETPICNVRRSIIPI